MPRRCNNKLKHTVTSSVTEEKDIKEGPKDIIHVVVTEEIFIPYVDRVANSQRTGMKWKESSLSYLSKDIKFQTTSHQ